jgi:glyoxylase I family protein
MGMAIQTRGIHHIALRSTDLARSREFYVGTLGFPVALEGPGLFIMLAGQTAVAVRGPEASTPKGDVFNPFRAGLDHVALACGDERELRRVTAALAAAAIENTGIKLDPTLNRQYVAFKDPDRIAWELYMAPDQNRRAVDAYFEGLRRGNVDDIPFAPDVSFESPLTAPLSGVDAVRGFLRSALPLIRDVRVSQIIAEGDTFGARFDLDTTLGVIPAFDWFRVVDGFIVEARPFFDPSPILAMSSIRN